MSSEASEAHQQRIDEILSIYIQSRMTGRKTNNLNLKISTNNSSKPPRSTPIRLRTTGPFKVPSSSTTTITTTAVSNNNNNKARRHSSSTTHINKSARVSFQKLDTTTTTNPDREREVGGERECDREVESTLFHSLRESPISENDEEENDGQSSDPNIFPPTNTRPSHPLRAVTSSPSSRRDSPVMSPGPPPAFYSDRTDRDKRELESGPDPKESYSRILATLKRIEDEEKLNFGFPLGKGDCGNGGGESNEEILDKMKILPSLTSISPPAQFFEQYPSRPCTPTSSPSPQLIPCSNSLSPRKVNSRFTTTSTAMTIISGSGGASVTSSLSCQSTPRLPPLDSPNQNNSSNNRGFEHNLGNSDGLHSARSYPEEPIRLNNPNFEGRQRPASVSLAHSPRWETTDEKTKNIFSYLDEVERSDRETLFHLKIGKGHEAHGQHPSTSSVPDTFQNNYHQSRSEFPNQIMDSLIRRGSVELAREILLLERKIEEHKHNITVLEETLINQRELNMRHIKNSERDFKKRLKLQQEEFELALTRHQAFVDQLIAEKRTLQDKCEKILRDLRDSELKYQDQTKALQEKHLEEIKRLRRIQETSEKARRVKWMGNKTQEIRETTIKGLEPELQRVIQRHQQEMSEMRAWHANELHEMEERCSRKLVKQSQEIREQMMKEKDECLTRDRDLLARRHESDLEHVGQEMEAQKRRFLHELNEERERFDVEQQRVKELIQENVRKVELKAQVEYDSLKQQYETKLTGAEKRHETELKTLTNVHEAERQSYMANYTKKLEQAIAEKELILSQANKVEREAEMEEREKKLRQEFERQWKEEQELYESRLKRLQEKFQAEIQDFEEAEKELKNKFSQVKAELIGKEEEIFSLKTSLSLKEKQNSELVDSNMKMMEERANLTAVIRREFGSQIESLEQDCMVVKTSVVELKSKHKMEQEQHQMELEKVRMEKDLELDKVGQRVVQAMMKKEETILELQKQLEKASFRVGHLEDLLEVQRKEMVKSMTSASSASGNKNRNKK